VRDAEALARLGVAREDAALVLAEPPHDDELVERLRAELVAGLGEQLPPVDWPRRDDFLHVHVLLAALPAVRAYQAERGVPDGVTWATLGGLGLAVAEHRRRYGRPGFDHAWWLSLHWRAQLFRLGRLQFERRTSGLSVHIPRGAPLAPPACNASFAAAPVFFARHFPEQPAEVARCRSWLLDPQLAEYLPPESNIVRFQRRFELDDEIADADEDILMFVFGAAAADPPQRTTLERAVVAHLAAGRHWHERRGALVL
jgi:hypothetical protein